MPFTRASGMYSQGWSDVDDSAEDSYWYGLKNRCQEDERDHSELTEGRSLGGNPQEKGIVNAEEKGITMGVLANMTSPEIRRYISDKMCCLIDSLFLHDTNSEWSERHLYKTWTPQNKYTAILYINNLLPAELPHKYTEELTDEMMQILTTCLRLIFIVKEDDHRDTSLMRRAKTSFNGEASGALDLGNDTDTLIQHPSVSDCKKEALQGDCAPSIHHDMATGERAAEWLKKIMHTEIVFGLRVVESIHEYKGAQV